MTMFMNLLISELKMKLREPTAMFFSIIFAPMMVIIFGAIFGNDPVQDGSELGYLDVMVPGFIGLVLMTVTMMGMMSTIAEYRQHRIFRRLRATPLSPTTIIIVNTLVYLVEAVGGIMLLIICGKVFYQVQDPASWLKIAAIMLLSYAAFATLGFAVGGFVKTARMASTWGNILYFPMLFLSGAALPREVFPDSLRKATEWLPLTQAINSLKDAWNGREISLTPIIYLVVMTIIFGVIAARTFQWE